MNIACDLFATTVKTPLNRFVVRAVCSFARSQGISPVRPFFKGRKKRNPGNEVGCYHLGKYIFKQRGGNLDLPQVDFWLIHRLFISLTRSERVTNL